MLSLDLFSLIMAEHGKSEYRGCVTFYLNVYEISVSASPVSYAMVTKELDKHLNVNSEGKRYSDIFMQYMHRSLYERQSYYINICI